ncbi:MAG: sensor histidine kinase [bacterium]
MSEELMHEMSYEMEGVVPIAGLIILSPRERACVVTVARMITPHTHDLTSAWSTIFFSHLSTQKGVPLEEIMKHPENISLQAHLISLVDDLARNIGEDDLEGYVRQVVELGVCMAKEDLPFETVVQGFHFFEVVTDTFLSERFSDSAELFETLKSMDTLCHATLAVIAKEYFNEKNRRINLLQVSRAEMVTGLVHDVRDKLSFGKTLPDMYRSGVFEKNPEKLGHYMDMLKDIMEEALEVITHALDYGKIIDGSYKIKARKTDLVSLVRRIVEPFIKILEDEHKKVFINGQLYKGGPVDLKAMAYVDTKQIGRVFGSLFANAVKYTRDEIRFTFEERECCIWCSVTDNGIGIAEEHKKKMFHSGIAGIQIPGDHMEVNYGICTDTVKRIVELHGGSIGVDSSPDTGTTFYFCIPKSPSR